jgi:hypothetical protein
MPIMPFESTRRARCATTQSGCTSTYKDDAQDRGVLLITSTFCAARIHKCEPAFRSSRRVHLLPQTHGARCRLLRVGRGNISACGQANGSSPFERNAVISWHFERDPIPYALETDSNLCILDCNSPKTPGQGVRIRTSASWNRDLSSGPGPELAYLELQVRRLHSQKMSQASDRRRSPLSHDEVHQD